MMKITGKNTAKAPSHVQFSRKLSEVPLHAGLPTIEEMTDELMGYMDIMLGRVDPPVMSPYLGMMEVASAYYARGQELDMMIHNEELAGDVLRGSPYYKFRTGTLRSFIEAAKKMSDLGSRRLTQEDLLARQRYDATT